MIEYSYALYQDGVKVAQVYAASDKKAKSEIAHYALMYGQDGPVEIKRQKPSRSRPI